MTIVRHMQVCCRFTLLFTPVICARRYVNSKRWSIHVVRLLYVRELLYDRLWTERFFSALRSCLSKGCRSGGDVSPLFVSTLLRKLNAISPVSSGNYPPSNNSLLRQVIVGSGCVNGSTSRNTAVTGTAWVSWKAWYAPTQPSKANSAFHPSGVGKWVPALAGKAKAGIIHSVSGWMRGVQVKLWDPLRTRVIPKRLKVCSRQGAIQIHISLSLSHVQYLIASWRYFCLCVFSPSMYGVAGGNVHASHSVDGDQLETHSPS